MPPFADCISANHSNQYELAIKSDMGKIVYKKYFFTCPVLSPIPSTTTGVRLWSFTFGHQFVLTRRRLRLLLVVDCIDVGRADESA